MSDQELAWVSCDIASLARPLRVISDDAQAESITIDIFRGHFGSAVEFEDYQRLVIVIHVFLNQTAFIDIAPLATFRNVA